MKTLSLAQPLLQCNNNALYTNILLSAAPHEVPLCRIEHVGDLHSFSHTRRVGLNKTAGYIDSST